MIRKKLKWQKNECHYEALKYLYKSEFKKKSYGAYQTACRNKWIFDICSHMLTLGNEYKRMIYRIVFPNDFCYVGLTNNFDRRIYEHLNTKGVVFSFINKYNLKPIVEKMTDYINVEDAKLQEEYWKNKSEEDGYVCLNKAKTGGLGCSILKWTKEECQIEAIKYNNRNDFMINSHSAYNSARKNKWIDEICSHMIILRKKYTKYDCQIEALKYKNRGEFANNNHNIWDFARKNNWLEEICSHMIVLKKPKNYWTVDNCIEEALKYSKPIELKKNKPNVYVKLRKNNLIKKIYKK